MQEEKTYQFEIVNISYINGERTPIDYAYRKTLFESEDELIDYKKYIQNRLNKRLYFSIKDLRDKESKPRGYEHLKVIYTPKETEETIENINN